MGLTCRPAGRARRQAPWRPSFRISLSCPSVAGLLRLLRAAPAREEARHARRAASRTEGGLPRPVRQAVYDQPASAYRTLLATIGASTAIWRRWCAGRAWRGRCAPSSRGVDLTRMSSSNLCPLSRRDTNRGHLPGPQPTATVHVPKGTSGSRGPATRVAQDLRILRDESVDSGSALDAYGGRGWRQATWSAPGGMAMEILLVFAAAGAGRSTGSEADPVDRRPGTAGVPGPCAWAAPWQAFLPRPEHVPLEVPQPIARWMAATLRAAGCPTSSPSPAQRCGRARRRSLAIVSGALACRRRANRRPARVASSRRGPGEFTPSTGPPSGVHRARLPSAGRATKSTSSAIFMPSHSPPLQAGRGRRR